MIIWYAFYVSCVAANEFLQIAHIYFLLQYVPLLATQYILTLSLQIQFVKKCENLCDNQVFSMCDEVTFFRDLN